MKLSQIITAGVLTFSLVTITYGGTITGSRSSAAASRSGLISGSRAGTITGSRTGTISGSRTGTITGSRVTSFDPNGPRVVTRADEFLSTIITLMVNFGW